LEAKEGEKKELTQSGGGPKGKIKIIQFTEEICVNRTVYI